MSGRRARWRRVFWFSALTAVLLAGSLLPYLTASTELVRLRNSLLYEAASAEAEWSPDSVPSSYRLERGAPNAVFRSAVASGGLAVEGNDWETSLRIGRHLLQGVIAHRGQGGAIQQGLDQTYGRITGKGEGYCGDYVDVFTGLANTAGVFARAWAFSFDGFGGHGHIFNEIWDRQARAWRMIDVFNNYYVVDTDERPMSALEFREALLRGDAIRWRPVEPAARPGFRHPEKALEYYRRGVRQWYAWEGNNVFEVDQHPVVNRLGRVSPALGQLSAVLYGVHPKIRVLADPENAAMQARLARTGWHFALVLVLVPLLGLLMLWSVWQARHASARAMRGGRDDHS